MLFRIEYSSPGDLCQKKGKHEEEHRHAREGPRKSCWRRPSGCMEESVNRNRACDSVISTEHVPDHEVHQSVESRRGENFQSATGEPILNLGDLRLPLYMREGTVRGMVMKASPLSKLLGSVKVVCQAGHTVVFDDEGSFIMNQNTLDAWIPPPQQGSNKTIFAPAAVTNKIGVSSKYRHNRVGAVGDGIED